jgi:Holliday junction resolvasome RuvABC endonuclease subunit
MRILGLDLSTKKSGYSLFKDQEIVDYGVWSLVNDKEKNWRERILWMGEQLDEYFSTHKVDKVICEDVPPTVDNSQTVKILSALQGCLMGICASYNIEVEFIAVTTWKNIIGIDLTHSKQYKDYIKVHKDEELDLFRKYVKNYEKALSVQNANHYLSWFGEPALQWISFESKFNQDDTADSINIVLSQIMGEKASFVNEPFEYILDNLYALSRENREKRRRGFLGKR